MTSSPIYLMCFRSPHRELFLVLYGDIFGVLDVKRYAVRHTITEYYISQLDYAAVMEKEEKLFGRFTRASKGTLQSKVQEQAEAGSIAALLMLANTPSSYWDLLDANIKNRKIFQKNSL